MANEQAAELLKSFVERAERLDREEAEIQEARKELLAEVKGKGFDQATFKEVLKARKQDPAQRAEKAALFNLYFDAAKGS